MNRNALRPFPVVALLLLPLIVFPAVAVVALLALANGAMFLVGHTLIACADWGLARTSN